MKKNLLLAFIFILTISGCTSIDYQGQSATKTSWVGTGGVVTVRSEKKSDSVYRIVAEGAALSKERHVEKAWNDFADNIAMGSEYVKTNRFEDYQYRTAEFGAPYKALRLVGEIRLEE